MSFGTAAAETLPSVQFSKGPDFNTDELIRASLKYRNDPLGYCEWAWDWGHGELEGKAIRKWQKRLLFGLGTQLRDQAGQKHQVARFATATGHGVGKSALMGMLSNWAMSTWLDCRGIITANTELQLKTKTWPEVDKWHSRSLTKPWFKLTQTMLQGKGEHASSWCIAKVPWSANNSEAFSGLHNEGKRIIIFFDEASAIHPIIWEAVQGFLTDENTQIIWIVFGNPTRNNGEFYNCFHRWRERWTLTHLDARDVEGTNKIQIDQWIEDYGIDSDFVRVRVLGKFPRAGDMQFISSDLVGEAQRRVPYSEIADPFIMGVDVAYGGSAQSVIYYRKGFDGRTQPPFKIRGRHTKDLVRLQGVVADRYRHYNADAIFVDGGGVGAGVFRNLKELQIPVIEVNSSWAASDSIYANKRAEMWGLMKDWLRLGGGICPQDHELEADLVGPEYHYRAKDNAILLTPKEQMLHLLGIPSPDTADALALTFAYPVPRRPNAGGLGLHGGNVRQPKMDWDELKGVGSDDGEDWED